MKVLMINGSPRPNGNDAVALKEMERFLRRKGLKWRRSSSAIRISGDVSAA